MSLRQLFLFLDPGGCDDRMVMDCDGVETVLSWVPDAVSAARAAAEETQIGLGIVELYRGFDVVAAAAVVEEVGDRAAVGFAVYPHGVASPSRIMFSATIFNSGEAAIDPVVRHHPGGGRTVVVGAPEQADVAEIARTLIDDGAELVEICGGEPLRAVARVYDAVGVRAPISYVVYPFDSLERASAFKNHFTKTG